MVGPYVLKHFVHMYPGSLAKLVVDTEYIPTSKRNTFLLFILGRHISVGSKFCIMSGLFKNWILMLLEANDHGNVQLDRSRFASRGVIVSSGWGGRLQCRPK